MHAEQGFARDHACSMKSDVCNRWAMPDPTHLTQRLYHAHIQLCGRVLEVDAHAPDGVAPSSRKVPGAGAIGAGKQMLRGAGLKLSAHAWGRAWADSFLWRHL
jgi:hypothetical protein